MKLVTAAALALALASPALAEKPKSIVGEWAFPGGSCQDAISIGPMAMKSTDVDCRFDTVKRKSRQVTWTGVCDDAEGSSRQTVVAAEKNGRLTISYLPGGNVLEDLWRCEP
jgi:hypothetical protein